MESLYLRNAVSLVFEARGTGKGVHDSHFFLLLLAISLPESLSSSDEEQDQGHHISLWSLLYLRNQKVLDTSQGKVIFGRNIEHR